MWTHTHIYTHIYLQIPYIYKYVYMSIRIYVYISGDTGTLGVDHLSYFFFLFSVWTQGPVGLFALATLCFLACHTHFVLKSSFFSFSWTHEPVRLFVLETLGAFCTIFTSNPLSCVFHLVFCFLSDGDLWGCPRQQHWVPLTLIFIFFFHISFFFSHIIFFPHLFFHFLWRRDWWR